MKRIYIAIALMGALLLTGCGRSRLAVELKGSWSGAPEHLVAEGIPSSTITPVYTFYNDADSLAEQGEVTIAAMISAMVPDAASDQAVQPVSTSVSGVGTVSGTWTLSGDRVELTLDPSTINVNINPSSVVAVENMASQQETPVVAPISPEAAATIARSLTGALKMRFAMETGFDGVSIKGDVMECSVMDRKMVLHRSMQAF